MYTKDGNSSGTDKQVTNEANETSSTVFKKQVAQSWTRGRTATSHGNAVLGFLVELECSLTTIIPRYPLAQKGDA